ncbi:MAG: GNAT family N-acetyltransferase [Phycisphaerae bacterium]|nr:GNAT family N-acetyltransferase [Phycisphaerae bacterium]
MQFNLYNDIKSFYKDVYDVLMRHESQNMIPLGNVIIGHTGTDKTGWRDAANWLMATVSDDTGIRLTGVMTPPHQLTLYATDNHVDAAALACLVEGMIDTRFSVPGVMSEKTLAEQFAKTYAVAKGVGYIIQKSMRLYELSRVNPDIPNVGDVRSARESDMAFLPYWIEGFGRDCQVPHRMNLDGENARYEVAAKRMYVLEDNGTPVSIAKITRDLQTVCGIGHVYTPPYFRGKGYATSCVAAVSRLMLERGFTKCILYTDLANPTSNSIYQKIGYTPISDASEIVFE